LISWVFELDKGADNFEKAAIVLNGIITRHPFMDGHKRTAFQVADIPFMDGHKRTAFQVADIILRDEGYHIHTDKIQIEKFLLKIAKYECEIDDINKWLKKRCIRLKKSRQLQVTIEPNVPLIHDYDAYFL